jgi:hypothetical protein
MRTAKRKSQPERRREIIPGHIREIRTSPTHVVYLSVQEARRSEYRDVEWARTKGGVGVTCAGEQQV